MGFGLNKVLLTNRGLLITDSKLIKNSTIFIILYYYNILK